MRRAIAIVLIALAFLVFGPRLTSPQPKKAGASFVYEPPEGFTRGPDQKDAVVWTFDERAFGAKQIQQPPTAVVTHSAKEMSIEERDLAKLAEEMPSAFDQCRWVHRRHELRTRADGARVGLIEGDCDHDVDLAAFGLPAKTIKTRKLQLMFPDDSGTSIVTASYPTDQATRWEPLFEATIGKAKGVATRVLPPPDWMYAAWGLAGLVIGWLVSALALPKRPATSDEKQPTT
ncbi:MAG: hypothetical protein KIT84_29280 [Labilithrix sp.]|nr:hypothetical protein [Labilithrix sp.]MCW5815155.1 hypothetical protein [Labilithrix sp.]